MPAQHIHDKRTPASHRIKSMKFSLRQTSSAIPLDIPVEIDASSTMSSDSSSDDQVTPVPRMDNKASTQAIADPPPSLCAEMPIFSDTSRATPTAHNYITRDTASKDMVRRLLDNRQMIPAPELHNSYLKLCGIPTKTPGKLRPIVDGKDAKDRGIICPRYSYPASVTDAARSVVQNEWFYATDLRGAYGQILLPYSKFLTCRINGRIYRFLSPPQGLSSSPAICTNIFNKAFRWAGFDASYVDNGVGGANTEEEAHARFEEGMKKLESLFTINREETIPPCRKLEWCGINIASNTLSLPPGKKEKLARLLEKGSPDQLQGYYSYLHDVFGPDRTTKSFRPVTTWCDGAKSQGAAAVVICDACDGVVEAARKPMIQGSQVNSELESILLGDRLARKHLCTQVRTDALYAVMAQRSKQRKRTICNSVVKDLLPLQHVRSEDNRADGLSRNENWKGIGCKCI